MRGDSPDTEWRQLFSDAYKSAGRASLAVDYEQFVDLLDYIDKELGERPCDHTTRHAERWAESHGIDWAELAECLREFDGRCDCEIALNVQPEEIFG